VPIFLTTIVYGITGVDIGEDADEGGRGRGRGRVGEGG
jgi:hypothetical protein